MSLELTDALIASQTPEAQAIIRLLLARIQELEDRLLRTPQNSSLRKNGATHDLLTSFSI